MIGRLNHVAIAVPDLEAGRALYRDTLGAEVSEPVDQPEHGVTTVFVDLPNTKIELLLPLGSDSPITRFQERNPAGGIHHICYEVTDIRAARDRLCTASGGQVDCIAFGSPHFSVAECESLARLLDGRRSRVPIYVCTNRAVMDELEKRGSADALRDGGVVFVLDTCLVVTPILCGHDGVLMTNSAKFAHYAPANTGYASVFGSMSDCVESALNARIQRDETLWQ